MGKELHAKGMAIADRVGGLFVDYQPRASLLHGDLWSGNVGQLADNAPAIFDPACYWGDRETDIAMSELLGGFPTSFHTAYQAIGHWMTAMNDASRSTTCITSSTITTCLATPISARPGA